MIGNKIKELRKSHNLTLEELADTLNKEYPDTINFNKGRISKWENNKEEPRLSSVKILADFFDVPLDYFNGIDLEQAEILQEQLKLINNAFLESLSFEDYRTLEQVVKLFSRPDENAKKGFLDLFHSPKSPQQSLQLTAEELKVIFPIFNKIITKITE